MTAAKFLAYFHNMIKRPMVLFTASRYFGYAMRFVKGMLIAKILGPEMLGVWGFLNLVNQYLQYSSCGVEYAVTVDLATKPNDESGQTIPVALTVSVFSVALLVLLSFASSYFEIPILEKYGFSKYALILALISGLQNIQSVFTNIYRVYQGLGRIAAAELLQVFIPLLAIFIYPVDHMIYALLGAMTISSVVAIALFVIRAPFIISLSLNLQALRNLLAVGVPLLVYNLTAYLVTDSGRMVLSAYYPVQAMGYYSFANSIINAILLGLRAVMWVIFPIILSKTHNGVENAAAAKTVHKVNSLYRTAVFLVILCVVLVLPLLFVLLPEYKPVESTLTILLLVQAVNSISFGYNTIAIARGKHRQVASISIASAIISAVLSLVVAILKFDFEWIAVAVFVGIFVYTILQIRLGEYLLNGPKISLERWLEIIPVGNIVAFAALFVGSLVGYTLIGAVVGMVVFVLTSREDLMELYHFALRVR